MNKNKALLVFQTDFTYKEGAIAAMYGVVKSVDRELEIFDATHEIPQYDIWSASFRLMQYIHFWPVGTVFVSVVDPGVGTARKACVARLKGGYLLVTPDNGTLTHISGSMGIEEVREINESAHRLRGKGTEHTNVFHGRDLFGHIAAKLAAGIITFENVGPAYPVAQIVTLPTQQPTTQPGMANGILEIGDPNFGNVWTNIPLEDLMAAGFAYGDLVRVTVHYDGELIFDKVLPFQPSFGYAQKGEGVIYNNEIMNVSLAINQGSFMDTYNVGYGPQWAVAFKKTA